MNCKKILLLGAFLALFTASIFAEGKYAFVVGIEKYKNSPLNNPVSDAKAVSEKLKGMGFSVQETYDATTKEFDSELKKFYKNIESADLALFYYSGHGMEYNKTNYLIPINEEIKTENDLKRNAVSLNDIMDEVGETNCSKLIVILDACRNNPLGKNRSLGSTKGLEVVTASSSLENFIIYATAAGETADDGNSNHSPFTAALLNHMEEKVPFYKVAQEVSREVQEATGGKQTPYKYDNLTTDIYLNGGSGKSFYEDVNLDEKYKGSFGAAQSPAPVALIVVLIVLMLVAAAAVVYILIKKPWRNQNSKTEKTVEVTEIPVVEKKNSEEKKSEEKSVEKKTTEEKVVQEAVQEKTVNEKPFALPQELVNEKFYVTKTPVTVGQYSAIKTNPSDYIEIDFPVTSVSYVDAAAFCNEMSRQHELECVYKIKGDEVSFDASKNGWRLPSEREWEEAYGPDLSEEEVKESACYADNTDCALVKCQSKKANANGLYDMSGLVREWCNDLLQNKWRVLKGGAWDSELFMLAKKFTDRELSAYKSDNIGFRMVRNK